MRTRALLTMATAGALVLTGCADEDVGAGDDRTVEDQAGAPAEPDGDDDAAALELGSPSPEVGASSLPVDQPTSDAGAGTTVSVEAFSFPDEPITVSAGTPVTFVNQDDVNHTVTSGTPDDPPEPSSGVFDEDLPAAGEATITVDEPGTYPFFCEVHQDMTGELVVEESSG